MDIGKRKEEIRKAHFSSGAMTIISILGLVGLVFVIISGIFNVSDYETFIKCISDNGIQIIFGTFFFLLCLFCWYLYYVNVCVDPKKELLYLEKEDGLYKFINKKGKKIYYDNNDLEPYKYYYVLKTKSYVYEVLNQTTDSFEK